MHQNQVRPADGAGRFQQISDQPAGCRLPRCGELGWITRHPQDVEPAQIVDVQSDAVEYLAVVHVLSRVAPPGPDDLVVPSRAQKGRRSWCL